MSEAPERIWVWGWRADSVWQEQTWQHEDEPMSTMEYVRVDLVEAAEQRGYANAMEAERKLHEARIEELEVECNKAALWAREQHASADRYAARIEELEGKLAKAVETLKRYGGVMPIAFTPIQDGGYKARTTLAELTGGKDE